MKFRREYGFLSNMYDCGVVLELDGHAYRFRNAEAAYQAGKCPTRAHEFEDLTGPDAKHFGRNVQVRPDWDSVKLDHMLAVLRAKFGQNRYLANRLRALDEPIVEENTWGDRYWGTCNGIGKNWLGRLLTKVRAEL